ncbi:MAG: glycosyltransferase [Ilumatobacter sp.]|uniref:glycosyltransferase family 2 protein n=1 Tax=Ilumatobacter sp. TaxID=1967498 RepID=UPI0032981A16
MSRNFQDLNHTGPPSRSAVLKENARRSVSVVISTKNRDSIGDSVRSVLASEGIDIELIVVDQSECAGTGSTLDLVDDDRLVILRSVTSGVSCGRNIGLRAASHEIVLIIDDDVTVPEDWARRFHAAVSSAEKVAVAFCRVDPGEHDIQLGFIPDHAVGELRVVRSLMTKSLARGIGAGMAVRRKHVLSIGGFDELLGPGARLRSAEDRDLAARVLAAGWWVLQTPDAVVLHHGFRTWEQGRGLTRRDWYGIGAAYAKQLKCRNLGILPVIAHEVLWFGLIKPVFYFATGRRYNGLRRIGYFVEGLVVGLRIPVDPCTMLYVDDEAAAP